MYLSSFIQKLVTSFFDGEFTTYLIYEFAALITKDASWHPVRVEHLDNDCVNTTAYIANETQLA